jgi:hypothetical protein
MTEHQTKLKPGEIQFHQWCEPPLDPGDYTLDVAQNVEELTKADGTFNDTFSFSVAGPRFALNPADVYSVYPPKGQSGDFAQTLPHLLFTRRTLPWERTLVPGPRKLKPAVDRRPWMALLVLSAQDFKTSTQPNGVYPKIVSRPLKELITSDVTVGPQLTLAAYEKETDLCNTIDLPWDLFTSIAPSEKDLGYLAHVREVNTGNKETSSLLADGWFSVVVANRFPQPEDDKAESPVENRVYLVSLEGTQKYLPGSGDPDANKQMLPVRLAILSSWSFQCQKAYSFKASMNALEVRRLCVPWHGGKFATLKSDAEKQVYHACELGYAALNHSTRLGEKAVSWYRGPLVPLDLTKQTVYRFLHAADAAVRYNPLDGMMDVSYAAAFQLGRLLALQDRYFATALYAYRKQVRSRVNQVLSLKRAQSALNVGGKAHSQENDLMSAYLESLDPKKPTEKKWSAATEYKLDNHDANANGNAPPDSTALKLTSDFDLTIPENVSQWLARLILLYRAPFTNLVADERMLPPDSMAFFYLDPGWLTCFLQGACSVGRSSAGDELVDQNLRNNFLKLALEGVKDVRGGKVTKKDGNVHTEAPPDWQQLTGFLMRSPIVEGWQGLEMQAWEDSGEGATHLLVPYRIDRLAPDIMLCIFKGKVQRIEIKQPPEGMHFGASFDGKEYRRIGLRQLNQSGTVSPGDEIDKTTETSIPLRPGPAKRVVKVSTLAKRLRKNLDTSKARQSGEFTSAEFGVEMVDSPGRAVFDVNPKST